MQSRSPWPQEPPRGHNLKSFALNPASPRIGPRLEDSTTL